MSRPDTALRRSDELLAVGQPAAALSAVSEIFSSKRFRSTPLSSLEPIMLRFLELCVSLRKGRTAKEGLHLYKNVAQNTSVTAVETVIKFFLDKSKEKLDEALAKVDEVAGPAPASGTTAAAGAAAATSSADGGDGTAEAASASPAPGTTTAVTKEDGSVQTVDVEDLEAAETPESILLSTVSDEKSRDRTYRTFVTPWLRFLWESYRTALDILRNNARLEVLYQQVALDAFDFCLKHTRKTEFRRLAETLRQHFANAQKYSQQTYSINISEPETLQRHLDIRFAQLNTAVELELWQEAFRSAEDIHGLIAASKRTPRPSMMASFYDKLVKVFAVGQNFLFHAAAYSKLWNLQATSGSADSNDRIAGLVLLSALSVPITASTERGIRKDPITGEERDVTRGRMTLMGLLDLPSAPSRDTLLRDAIKRGILKSVSKELRELFNIIEVDFHPLRITSKLEPIFANLRSNPETQRYVEPLKNVVLSRLFQQLGQVYDSVKLNRIVKLATFKDDAEQDASVARVRIEKFITDACRRGELTVRLDHVEGIVEFEDKPFQQTGADDETAGTSSVDVLQPTPASLLRTHLTRLARTLYVSLDTITPDSSALALAKGQAEAALQSLAANMEKEREAVLARRLITEQRRQKADAEALRKEKEAEAARIAARQEQAIREAKRVEQEAKARQLEMIRKANEAVKAEEARKLAEKLQAAGALKVVPKDMESLDTSTLMKIQVDQIEKDRKTMAEKLRIIGKRIDHTERAFRKEEVPLLHQDYEIQQKRDREIHESTRKMRLEELRAAHEFDLRIKHRLDSIMPDYETFREKKLAAVQGEYERKVEQSRRRIEEEKARRKAEVEAKRAEIKAAREREEAERRAAEEEERARQEEEERRAEEERIAREEEEARLAEEKRVAEEAAAKKRAEETERRMKLDETFRKQRERELEVERKLQEREAAKKEQAVRVPGLSGWRREGAAAAPAGATPVTASNEAAPAAGGAGAAAPSGERKRLNLAPRTAPAPAAAGGSWRDREAAAPAPAASTAVPPAAAGHTGERPRISLAPRTTPASQGGAPAAAAAGGSWREREAARKAAGSPAGGAATNGSAAAEDDGFQPVKKPAGGAYRPPGARSDGKWGRS